jgi:aspartate dehydrogenase
MKVPMSQKLKIGIVGCGAIGTSLAQAIKREFRSQAVLTAVYDTEPVQTKKLLRRVGLSPARACRSLDTLIRRSRLVIECASARAALEIARRSLQRRRDVMIMSAGGVLMHLDTLRRLASRARCRVYIPSGAIAGMDAVRAAREAGITRSCLTTRKPPKAFEGVAYVQKKNIFLTRLTRDKVLFDGQARDAVRLFPQNVNVGAVLSLSGIGAQKTRVRIIASPSEKRNCHEVRVESRGGVVSTKVENVLHPDNPKTSFMAVLSAVALLRRILEPVTVGS